MPTDISTKTTGVVLPPAVSNEIWAGIVNESAVMQLARQMDLPGNGVSIPTITGEPTAGWVDETDPAPVSRPTLGNKLITGYELTVLVPFSKKFLRDLPGLYKELKRRLPLALAKKFDSTVFGPSSGAPGTNFDTLGAAGTVSIAANAYDGLVTADGLISTADGILNGWALAPQAKKLLLTSKDDNGRPLFINNAQTEGSVPMLLGSPTHFTKGVYIPAVAPGENNNPPAIPAQIGFAGDWSDAVYGVVEGIKIETSDQATLIDGESVINLFQKRMFAVMATIEVGFRVKSLAEFVKLTG
jgi:HK97 family phage major capsid protein